MTTTTNKEQKEKSKGELPEGITQQQIDEWKEKYGEDEIRLKTLYRENSSEPVRVITRVPSRPIVSEFMKHIDKNFDKVMSILVTNCTIHGLDEVKKDKELFLTCGKAISDDIPMGRSESKKL